MKLQVKGRLLRNVDEDNPGVVVAVVNPDANVDWAVTGKTLNPDHPEADDEDGPTGIIGIHGGYAEDVATANATCYLNPEEAVDACDDEDGVMWLAATATMALIQAVEQAAPRGQWEIIRGFVDWHEATLHAAQDRMTDD